MTIERLQRRLEHSLSQLFPKETTYSKGLKNGIEKNYDKKSGTGPLWHDLSIGAGDQQYCFVFFSWKPDAAGKCGDDGKDDFRSRIHTQYGQTVAGAAAEGFERFRSQGARGSKPKNNRKSMQPIG